MLYGDFVLLYSSFCGTIQYTTRYAVGPDIEFTKGEKSFSNYLRQKKCCVVERFAGGENYQDQTYRDFIKLYKRIIIYANEI